MPQGGEFASYRPPVDGVPEQLLDEFADVRAAGVEQRAFALFEEPGKLPDIGRIRRQRERSQALLHFQVVEKAPNDAEISFRGHDPCQYARYRTFGGVAIEIQA